VIVIADTSILLNLCRIGMQDLLQQLYQNVVVPRSVRDEFERAAKVYPRFDGMAFPGFIHVTSPTTSLMQWAPWAQLDRGESDAIALSKEMAADLLLLDERKGRLVAAKLGIKFSGLLGILIQARQQELLTNLESVLDRLRSEAGFYLSDRHAAEALAAVGENP
jgi:predicted nucleic acid-binding protein